MASCNYLAQDPVLLAGLLLASTFILTFIAWPLLRVMVQGFFTQEGAFSLEEFRRYIDPSYTRYYRQVFYDTLRMGLLSASFGTALGFLFAYSYVRCNVPLKPLVYVLALLPTISPPFAIAIAAILLFGRNGLVTRRLLADSLGVDVYGHGFDLFGMTGLVLVQSITYFSVAYLILRGMLERLDASLEEKRQKTSAPRRGTSSAPSPCPCSSPASPAPSCCCLSKAWPISATRCSSPGTPPSCQRKSLLPSMASTTSKKVPPCRWCCCCQR